MKLLSLIAILYLDLIAILYLDLRSIILILPFYNKFVLIKEFREVARNFNQKH